MAAVGGPAGKGLASRIDLGIERSAMQESFGDAFLLAVAGAAGCAVSRPRPDDDSIDWTLSCRLSKRPKIDVQMKTWTGNAGAGEEIRYPLKRKNYDDLVLTDLCAPRVLVVVLVPSDVAEWLAASPEELVLRHSGYWVSLSGLPSSENTETVTVSVPRKNLLTPAALGTMMERVNQTGVL